MKIKRKCFAVLLIIVMVIQDPSVARSNQLGQGYFLREDNFVYSLTEEAVQRKALEALDQFQLQYYLNGGENDSVNPIIYRVSQLPIRLAAPTRAGYNFAGWYTDREYKHKISELDYDNAGNVSLFAKWTKEINSDYNVQMYSYKSTAKLNHRNKELKNCSYSFRQDIQIPGMPKTRESDVWDSKITDTNQSPQGICATGEYILVSAYTADNSENLGCIHVFNQKTGEYLATLGMKEKSHLGGITFDGENIWVCHSDNNTLECIPYVFVKRIAEKKPKNVVDCSALFEEFHVSNTPSCITWYEGKLWVATHTRILNSVMISYKVTRKGLRQVESYRVPDKVQGVAFDEKGRVYMSTSYGRNKSSYMKVYLSPDKMSDKPNSPMLKVEMPPCSEELAIVDDNIYILFESAGEKYLEGTDGKGKSISPLDKILTVSLSSVYK